MAVDKVKECAKKLKEAEIEHSAHTQTEKENMKYLWKEWIDTFTHGFRDKLKGKGRMA